MASVWPFPVSCFVLQQLFLNKKAVINELVLYREYTRVKNEKHMITFFSMILKFIEYSAPYKSMLMIWLRHAYQTNNVHEWLLKYYRQSIMVEFCWFNYIYNNPFLNSLLGFMETLLLKCTCLGNCFTVNHLVMLKIF